jgi:iron complex outermembrane receptor protein
VGCWRVRGHSAARIAVGAAAVALMAASAVPEPASADKRNFDVPVQPVETALIVFAKQAHIQLLVTPNLPKGLPETGLSGSYDISTALRILLRDTGLEFQFAGPDTITVRPKSITK